MGRMQMKRLLLLASSLTIAITDASSLHADDTSCSRMFQAGISRSSAPRWCRGNKLGFTAPLALPPRVSDVPRAQTRMFGVRSPRAARSADYWRGQQKNLVSSMSMSSEDSSSNGAMRWTSAVSLGFGGLIETVEEAADKCRENLGEGTSIDLVMCYISDRFFEMRGSQEPARQEDLMKVTELLRTRLGAKHVIGCLSPGVIGMGEEESPEEYEQVKAVSISAACLPNVDVKIQRRVVVVVNTSISVRDNANHDQTIIIINININININYISFSSPLSVAAEEVPNNDSVEEWRRLVGSPDPADRPVFLLFSEHNFPGRGNLDRFLEGMDFAYPGCTKVGGLTARFKQDVDLLSTVFGDVQLTRDKVASPGVWVVTLSGDIEAEALVAQGCRPIGPEWEVSRTKGNKVFEVFDPLKKEAPVTCLAALSKVIEGLSPAELELAQRALFVGVESNSMNLSDLQQPKTAQSSQEDPRKDYLLRPIILVSANDKSMLVGDVLRPGSTCPTDQLRWQRLTELLTGSSSTPAAGLVLFACIGRGRPLFGEPNYESRMASMATGVPVVGCFYNGEFGPAGGQASLHEYTSIYTIFRSKKLGGVTSDSKMKEQEGEQNNSGT
ncbi:hypothetical protein GUITHDRAFT_100378 [Guillardia theta CCMP2712]|uniref:FIST C-domain domain-containing protein n=1 Tax=Guillardia theta (strain CCMP2712) TaxID=905079 RepID=L1JZU6_GUITC|nr:hypothetical protein GUITHDRAFT_100378 [Guillardia theta CCMP2712]EKX54131.1 hypothetical protein GUITHDRAFT_100378 [Guillardia theta CCMP2712]|eukprot:XP_005841111.1 hypothetical protein GUITHDRAFT_100378 [Guillardia theta CCMP2712]